jgi:outer membrane protein TolC
METIQISFEKLMTQLEITREKIDLFKNILPTLKENYRSSLSRFNIGAITLQELMDIEDEYISAELEYLNLLKNYNLTALEISSYVGNAQAIVEELL